jgi:RND family efflux transporter MFP subunit
MHYARSAAAAVGAALMIIACGTQQPQDQNAVTIPVSVLEIKLRPIAELLQTTGTVTPEKDVSIINEMVAYYSLQANPRTGKPFALGDQVKKDEVIIKLHDVDYESTNRVESQKLTLAIAKQSLDQERSLYEKGGAATTDLQNAELTVANDKFNYDDAVEKDSKLWIKPPFAGVIVNLPYYTQNTRITATGQLMAEVMDYDRLSLQTKLPANDMARVHVGQPVLMTNYTVPNDTAHGTITQVSPTVDPTSRTFQAVFIIDNPDKKFRPGMFVMANIVVARKDSAVVIPKEIILSDLKGKSVFVVDRGRAQARIIKTGIESENEIEVVGGLKAGERLVTKGFETLQDGSHVKILE